MANQLFLFFLLLLVHTFNGVYVQNKFITRERSDMLNNLSSPFLFKGDAVTAYRDPALLYHGKIIPYF